MQRFCLAFIVAATLIFTALPSEAQQVEQDGRLLTREQMRVAEAQKNGFRWVPWLSAGERVWKSVMRIEPKLKDIIGTGTYVDVAMMNPAIEGSPLILSFWGPDDCGVDGCLYLILKQDGSSKLAFTARVFERSGTGVKIDGRYLNL